MLERLDDTGYEKRVEKTGSTVGSNVVLDTDVWLEVRETAKPHIEKKEPEDA